MPEDLMLRTLSEVIVVVMIVIYASVRHWARGRARSAQTSDAVTVKVKSVTGIFTARLEREVPTAIDEVQKSVPPSG